jgi:hypothetical protein
MAQSGHSGLTARSASHPVSPTSSRGAQQVTGEHVAAIAPQVPIATSTPRTHRLHRRTLRPKGDRYWPRLTARPWCPDRSTVGVSGSSRHPAASACTASCGTYSCWSVVAVAQQSPEDHAYLRDDQHHEIPRLGESPCGMQWDGRAATEKCFSSHLKGIATVPASLLVETMRIR